MLARPDKQRRIERAHADLQIVGLDAHVAHGLGQHRVDDERHRQKRHRTGDDNKEQGEAQKLEHGR